MPALETHHWLLLLAGLLLLWGLSLLMVRAMVRRRLLRQWTREERAAAPELSLTPVRPEDHRAVEIITAYRRRFLTNPWPDTQLRWAVISDTAQSLLKDIARVYYPEEERPELKASLADLVVLVNRVGSRLNLWLNALPVRPLKDVEVGTLLKVHDLYRQVTEHPVYQFLKRHRLDQAARWLWTAKNLLNPWYWSRRAVYTGSRELFARLFLAQIVSLVGEEAIRLYGRRQPAAALKHRLHLALQEFINLTLEDGRLPGRVSAGLLQFILKARGLEDADRLELVAVVAAPRLLELPDPRELPEADRRQIRAWLEGLARRCFPGREREDCLTRIRERWPA